MQPLLIPTPATWLPTALADVPAVLIDHAHCEKKAAAHAMGLVSQYGDYTALVLPLVALAQEELRHFRQVVKIMQARGLTLSQDAGDPYVQRLMREARHGRAQRLVDRLLIASLVEARSAERLGLLGDGLAAANDPADAALAPFYQRLAKTEAGHHRLFVRLARRIEPAAAVVLRLSALAEVEAEAMVAQPPEARIH
jgi:tRNA-(ms[2]io[6]A)-hydroxylase